mgnify:CR=1 FL=1
MSDEGRIFILTGPNSGGKTTYIQAVGALQIMFQAGVFIPCGKAWLSPVDNLYTHFPVEEKTGMEQEDLEKNQNASMKYSKLLPATAL